MAQIHPQAAPRASRKRVSNPYETIAENPMYDVPGSVATTTSQQQEPRYMNQPGLVRQTSGDPLSSGPPLPPRGLQKDTLPTNREHIYDSPDQSNGGGVLLSPAYFNSGNAVPDLEKENHQLRLNLSDKNEEIKTLQRSLDHSHSQIKQLNIMLAEKKESILQYQEKISDMQTTVAELQEQRDHVISPTSVTPAEEALQHQLQQMRHQLTENQRQLNDASRTNAQLQVQLSQRDQEMDVLRQMQGNQQEVVGLRTEVDRLRQERAALGQDNQRLASEVEVLNLQVTTYGEDFQSEREDRERAQGEMMTIKDEKESLQQFIRLLAQEHNIRLDNYGMGELANQIGNVPQPQH